MSIVFFGTPHFAVPSLQVLIDNKERVSLVVTQPDKRRGRSRRISEPPVKVTALQHNIEVRQPERLSDESLLDRLRDISPEFIVVVAYGKLLKRPLLSIPERGCINVHASLLPQYRGAAPVQWAIINDEKITGVTTMLMDEGMDTGDILLQKQTEIKKEDSSESLSARLSTIGAVLLLETIKELRSGNIRPKPQSGPASYANILKKSDGIIDWHKDAVSLFNFVRGMSPWPCAFTHLNSKYIKIIDAEPVAGTGTPGTVEKISKERILVGTGSGLLSIKTLQPEGKKPIQSRAFVNGYRLQEGDRFDQS